MDQQLLQQAYILEKQSNEIAENLSLIEKEINELQEFNKNLFFLQENKGNEMLSSLGKGIYLKTSLEDKKLFVEIGKGIIVKKNISETTEIVKFQINKLLDAKEAMSKKLEIYNLTLQSLIGELDK